MNDERDEREDHETRERVSRMVRITQVVLALNVIILLAGGIAGAYFSNLNSDRVDDIDRLATQNARLLHQIQVSRREATIATCEDTNMRHDATLRAIRIAIAEAKRTATPSELAEIHRQERQTKQTEFIINSLVPKRDCVKRANELVAPPPRRRR